MMCLVLFIKCIKNTIYAFLVCVSNNINYNDILNICAKIEPLDNSC